MRGGDYRAALHCTQHLCVLVATYCTNKETRVQQNVNPLHEVNAAKSLKNMRVCLLNANEMVCRIATFVVSTPF